MNGYNGRKIKHSVSERLYPHNVFSNEIVKGGFLQLSNGGNSVSPNLHYLRHIRKSGSEKQINLGASLEKSEETLTAYYPKLKMMFVSTSSKVTAINAQNGTIIWQQLIGSATNNHISMSVNRNTMKLHIRAQYPNYYKTYTVDIRTGANVMELTGTEANKWGTYDYRNNVFYNQGLYFTILTKADGTTGQVLATLAQSNQMVLSATLTKIEIDKAGNVLVSTFSNGNYQLNLLTKNLILKRYTYVTNVTRATSSTLDPNGSGNYYVSEYIVSTNTITRIRLRKYAPIGSDNEPSVFKEYIDFVTNSFVDSTSTGKRSTSFILSESMFTSIDSFNNAGTGYRTFWFFVNKDTLEVSFNPLGGVASNRYTSSFHIPYYGKVGE